MLILAASSGIRTCIFYFQALSKALLVLRAEMTANAEQQIISAASQKEAYMNVQEIVDRETKRLMVSTR